MDKQQQQQTFGFGRAIGTRVIVRVDDAADQTASGLFIPEMAKERPQFGTVLAVGSGITEKIEPQDRVMFSKHAGTQLMMLDVTYYIMQEREILIILDQEALDKAMLGMKEIKPMAPENKLDLAIPKTAFKVGEKIKITIGAIGTASVLVYAGKKLLSDARLNCKSDQSGYVMIATEQMIPEVRVEISLAEDKKNHYDAKTTKKGSITFEVYP